MTPATAVPLIPLRAEALLARVRDMGIATPRQIEQAKQELSTSQERFSAILVRQGLLRDVDAGKRLVSQLGSLPQRLETPPSPMPLAGRVNASLWRAQRLVPVRERDGRLLLATDDPFSVFALEFLSARCGCELDAVLVREQDLAPLLEAVERLTAPPAAAPAGPPSAQKPPPQTPPAAPPAPTADVRQTPPAVPASPPMAPSATAARADASARPASTFSTFVSGTFNKRRF